ncbi:MAG TPA: TIGR02996 domain-containing protein, partial [Kofleriaceae bacterium]
MKITLEGKVVVTTEGRKRSVRTFLTPEQAKVQYDKLVAEHALEQKAARRIKLTDPRHPELEQAIIDAPDDPSAFAVYADWLQSQNDPRGTLISTMLAPNPDSLENRKAIDREFKKHPAYYYGDLVRHAMDWKFGFIHSVRLTDERISPEGLGRVLAHPSGRFVTSLDIGDYPVRDAQPVIDELVRLAPPTLRSLSLYAQPGVDLTRLWATFPKLRSL